MKRQEINYQSAKFTHVRDAVESVSNFCEDR